MEHIFLAVVTEDKEYGRALSLAMLSICRGFIIRIFTADEFFHKRSQFDLILWDGKEAGTTYGGRLVYLAESLSDTVRNSVGKKYCIYKYSTATSLVAAVFEIYETVTGRRAVNVKRQNVRLFALASPAGGTGCTTIAMALGQELSRFQGKRVMYLSFEELESTGNFISAQTGIKGAGVYLYHLLKNRPCGMEESADTVNHPFLDGYVVRDDFGTEAFAPSQGRNPLRELNVYELHRFISAMIDSGRYDVILMDLGNWLSGIGVSCMEMAEKLCFVVSDRQGGGREEQYLSHIMGTCGEDMLNKVIKVRNHTDGKGQKPEQDEKDPSMADLCLEVGRGTGIIKEGNVKKILLEGAFGNDINLLAEKMMEPIGEKGGKEK